jgi:hypothetical protein
MTRDEFIAAYCDGSGQTWLQLQAILSAVPCACGAPLCRGWRMVARPHSLDEPAAAAEPAAEPTATTALAAVQPGAQVTMTAAEVEALAGDGPVRLVTGKDGRVFAGFGQVGLVEHFGETDLQALIDLAKEKRDGLRLAASAPPAENPRANLFTFAKI